MTVNSKKYLKQIPPPCGRKYKMFYIFQYTYLETHTGWQGVSCIPAWRWWAHRSWGPAAVSLCGYCRRSRRLWGSCGRGDAWLWRGACRSSGSQLVYHWSSKEQRQCQVNISLNKFHPGISAHVLISDLHHSFPLEWKATAHAPLSRSDVEPLTICWAEAKEERGAVPQPKCSSATGIKFLRSRMF